jgi:hypothetical protein
MDRAVYRIGQYRVLKQYPVEQPAPEPVIIETGPRQRTYGTSDA